MEKVWVILFLVGFVACAHRSQIKVSRVEESFFDSKGNVSQAVVDLLALTGTRVKGRPASAYLNSIAAYHRVLKNDDFDSVFNLVQGKTFDGKGTWLRNSGQERWDLKSSRTNAQDNAIREIFERLGFGKANHPDENAHSVIIFGAIIQNMLAKIKSVKNLMDQRYRFDDIWMLSGERSLISSEIKLAKSIGVSVGNPPDEGHAAKSLINQEFQEYSGKLHVIQALAPDGLTRARTVDTIAAFAKENPHSGEYVLVSTQPFALYQLLVSRKKLLQLKRSDINLTLATRRLDLIENKYNTDSLLDNLARIFYVLRESRSQND